MSKPILSIAIPTYNRAEILKETLDALETEIDPSWEIVISNNCSDDNTCQVIEDFSTRWKLLRGVTLKKNVPAMSNIDAALRLASGKYIYLLSDDDRLIPDGISRAVEMLEHNEQMVGVYGNHKEWIREKNNYTEARLLIKEDYVLKQGSHIEAFRDYPYLVNPIIRREIFQRFCKYDRYSFGFSPLIGRMLSHGDIGLMTDCLYLHAHTIPRMEHSLTEGWYHDMHRAQFETFIGQNFSGTADNGILISKLTTNAYIQGVRFSIEKKEYLTARSFMIRSRAYGLVTEIQIKEFEKLHIFNFIAELIVDTLAILPNIDEVIIEDHPHMQKITTLLQKHITDLKVISMDQRGLDNLSNIETKYLLVNKYEDLRRLTVKNDLQIGSGAALLDLFEIYRITKCALEEFV